MNKRPENSHLYRRCRICKETKPLNNIFFYNEKSRLYGLSYVCRPCESIRGKEKALKYPRKNRVYNFSPEQIERRRKHGRNYKLKALGIIKKYTLIDRKKGGRHVCDLTEDFLNQNILPCACVYCGDRWKIGCDRIDNSRGHSMDNVVPCCKLCNVTRMHNYTHEEMKLLGKVIMRIKKKRKKDTPHFEV